jgi:sugar/nucleoside kinase (ribokinase family)
VYTGGMHDVVCFGEALWDLYEVRAGTYVRYVGGAMANAATWIASEGVNCALVAAIGKDALGDALLAALGSVDTEHVVRVALPTPIVLVGAPWSPGGEQGAPAQAFAPYREGTADGGLRAAHVSHAMARTKWALVGSGTLVSHELARATEAFLDFVFRARARLCVDLNVRTHLWPNPKSIRPTLARVVRRADVVKGSAVDLVAIAGSEKAGLAWLAEHAPQAVHVVTRGGGKASARGDFGFVQADARRVTVKDPIGAGDAFTAGLLCALVKGETWVRALARGHTLGAKAVAKRGGSFSP